MMMLTFWSLGFLVPLTVSVGLNRGRVGQWQTGVRWSLILALLVPVGVMLQKTFGEPDGSPEATPGMREYAAGYAVGQWIVFASFGLLLASIGCEVARQWAMRQGRF
jgi:hypothetical protein